MTRLWIFSDLHAEQSRWTLSPTPDDVEVIVAAGDIYSPATRSVEKLAEISDGRPVIFVPGNAPVARMLRARRRVRQSQGGAPPVPANGT